MTSANASVDITQLWIYPVKSLAGIACQQAELTPLGLRYDRYWMITRSDGHFVTQRQLPALARITTRLTPSTLELACDGENLRIPLQHPVGEVRTAMIWHDNCQVIEEQASAGDWLTRMAGSTYPLHLVRMAADFSRPPPALDRFGEHSTYFADAAPLLVTNTASLAALNQQLQQEQLPPAEMRRFRPNIVIQGLPAWSEQQPLVLHHSHYRLRLCDRSSRCVMITIDPDTGTKHPQHYPYYSLRAINPMPDKPAVAAFGMNTVVDHIDTSTGTLIRCGDQLEVEL